MIRQTGFVVSASMAIVATQAMAHVARDAQGALEVDLSVQAHPDTEAAIDAALKQRDVREASRDAFDAIIRAYGRDGRTLADRFKLAQYNDSSGGLIGDPAAGGSASQCYAACHSNCHSNCHYACHGSRGWR